MQTQRPAITETNSLVRPVSLRILVCQLKTCGHDVSGDQTRFPDDCSSTNICRSFASDVLCGTGDETTLSVSLHQEEHASESPEKEGEIFLIVSWIAGHQNLLAPCHSSQYAKVSLVVAWAGFSRLPF